MAKSQAQRAKGQGKKAGTPDKRYVFALSSLRFALTAAPNFKPSLPTAALNFQIDVPQGENLICVLPHLAGQIEQTVTFGIDGPDNVTHRTNRLARDMRNRFERTVFPTVTRWAGPALG